MQRSQKAMAARYCPTQEHPNAPKQVQEQDGVHEYARINGYLSLQSDQLSAELDSAMRENGK